MPAAGVVHGEDMIESGDVGPTGFLDSREFVQAKSSMSNACSPSIRHGARPDGESISYMTNECLPRGECLHCSNAAPSCFGAMFIPRAR